MSLVKIKGGRELALALRGFSAKIEKQVMGEALVAGAKVIAAEAKLNVIEKTGALRRSIRVLKGGKKKKVKGIVRAEVVAGNKKVYYTHFVELGTVAHAIKGKDGGNLSFMVGGRFISTPSVNHTGMQAKPFLRPALDTKAVEAVRVVGAKITDFLAGKGVTPSAIFEVE